MRDRLRVWRGEVRSQALAARAWLRKYSAELSTAVAGLAGWLTLTWGLARLLGPVVWFFGIALLCFSLFGWRLLWQVSTDGLYALTRDEKDT